MNAKYTVKTATEDYPATRFRDANAIANMLETEGVAFGILSHLTGKYVDDKRPDVAKTTSGATPVSRRPATRRKATKCQASNYKIMQNGHDLPGFAYIIDPDDRRLIAEEGFCSCCGKRVKMRRFGNVGLIPSHNVPDDSEA